MFTQRICNLKNVPYIVMRGIGRPLRECLEFFRRPEESALTVA